MVFSLVFYLHCFQKAKCTAQNDTSDHFIILIKSFHDSNAKHFWGAKVFKEYEKNRLQIQSPIMIFLLLEKASFLNENLVQKSAQCP